MHFSLEQMAAVALYLLAGELLYIEVVNRWLILIRDGRLKGVIIAGGVLAVAAAAACAGLRLPWWPAAALLAVMLMLEFRRVRMRRAIHGSWPEGPRPHRPSLRRPFTTTDFRIYRYRIELPDWRGRPVRIVHLTDMHVHRRIPDAYFRRVMQAARDEKPDLAFFTGDYLAGQTPPERLRELLGPVGLCGDFAVLGNHDFWDRTEPITRALTDAGIRVLSGESVRVAAGDGELLLTGHDYPWGAQQKTLDPAPTGLPHFVLTHTPDNIYHLAASRPDCVFAGHCHAGQIRLPFWGPVVVPSVYGRRFDHGHFIVDGVHLFIPSGIGVANPLFRIYCEPDFFVIDVRGVGPAV
ncbi:MAG TPA: metallophosphoesterase [Kiritimatiellia bacterium]|nr:metallophosphoesterase [Kiritimatiellia bacterium]